MVLKGFPVYRLRTGWMMWNFYFICQYLIVFWNFLHHKTNNNFHFTVGSNMLTKKDSLYSIFFFSIIRFWVCSIKLQIFYKVFTQLLSSQEKENNIIEKLLFQCQHFQINDLILLYRNISHKKENRSLTHAKWFKKN